MNREFFVKNREKVVNELETSSVLVLFAEKVPNMNTDSRCNLMLTEIFIM